MISIKNKAAIKKMETAGALLAEVFDKISEIISPGISTLEIDSWIEKELISRKMLSRSKGYMGFKHVSCISLNEEIVHGVPSEKKLLKSGDLVKIDVCASWKGYCADMARSFFVEKASSPEAEKFVSVAEQALKAGIEKASAGNRLGDVSFAIQQVVEAHNYGIVVAFAGHGIGKEMHEDPEILNVGEPGKGPVLRHGMTLALELMITRGTNEVVVLSDGWAARTKDGSLAAHVEDTVLVTENGPRVLTRP